jgi:pimeloyl-ACP methyl ester carboxylesterase
VLWLWLVVGTLVTVILLSAALVVGYYFKIRERYLERIVRIFQEKPLFIVPRGQPVPDAEEVRLATPDGLSLCGCYLRTTAPRRRGVILFGLEYGSNRWACVPYCSFLREAGFDVFSFEPRSQGDSDAQPGYEPLQWVTEYEVRDFQAALAYLKQRPDADPRGIGFFGISKGGSAGVLAAARDLWVRCFATDGIFATHTTMLPYMRKWIAIYTDRKWVQTLVPDCIYSLFARACLRRVRRQCGVRFPHLEHVIGLLAPRPLLMIHGGSDTYIKPEMARALFELAGPPREFWLVDGAKHNQAMQVANGEYRRRLLAFFEQHLALDLAPAAPAAAVKLAGPSLPVVRS